jgi:cystathionine beta-lyase
MTYNFDNVPSRWNTNSYKYDSAPNQEIIPLWVADMDFPTAPVVQQAVEKRAQHPIFGYVKVPEDFYQSTMQWFSRRHGWSIPRDSFIYTSGVVPAISAIIQGITKPGDKVLVQTPVYNCFFSSIRNSGCICVDSPLVYEDRTYHIDFEDFESKLSDPQVKVFLMCNPHNPAGRVWTPEELKRVGDLCIKHNVFVISDEIHNELVMPGYKYTPFASLSEDFMMHSAICISPSKSFNIAGLQIANIIIADDKIRQLVDKAININEVCDVNPFGVAALQAAYTSDGEEWLNQLNAYISANYDLLCDFFEKELPNYPVTKLEGTYLAWINIKASGESSEHMEERLLNDHKVWINAGTMYGTEGFIRINLACPHATLLEGLKRIKAGLTQ